VEDTATGAKLAAYGAEGLDRPLSEGEKGSVVIMMDDGYESQYTRGYDILKRYGMKAAISVIPAAVGNAGYMNYQQLAELYMAGWDMMNHTYNHIELKGLGAEQQAEQISQGAEWLRGRRLARGSDILIYPGGQHDESTIDAIKKTGVAAARSLKSVWSTALGCTFEDVEICNVISGLSLENIELSIDKAANNRSAVVLVLNKIEPETDDTRMQTDEERLESIIEYIASKDDELDVITPSELLRARQ
jgi:peptidoglycan/xylan/chitin deacetylase (PgdA/CDA1 family)